jgi:hypothetical protein
MENTSKEKVVYAITDEFIQQEAEQEIDRQLTEAEMEQVVDCLYGDGWPIFEFIRECINKTIELNELIEKSKCAEKTTPHFKLYHKNANAYQPNLTLNASFETLEETKKYLRLNWDFISEFDQWKITRVDEDGEHEVEMIGDGKEVDISKN